MVPKTKTEATQLFMSVCNMSYNSAFIIRSFQVYPEAVHNLIITTLRQKMIECVISQQHLQCLKVTFGNERVFRTFKLSSLESKRADEANKRSIEANRRQIPGMLPVLSCVWVGVAGCGVGEIEWDCCCDPTGWFKTDQAALMQPADGAAAGNSCHTTDKLR